MAVGVKDIALAAGVSLGTVSNVLNHPERVSARTRARVEQVMADLGFVPNESARQLRAGRSRTLAYVVLDVSNPFFTDVAQGVEETVSAPRPLAVHVQQRQPRRPRAELPQPSRGAARRRRPAHPGGPGVPAPRPDLGRGARRS